RDKEKSRHGHSLNGERRPAEAAMLTPAWTGPVPAVGRPGDAFHMNPALGRLAARTSADHHAIARLQRVLRDAALRQASGAGPFRGILEQIPGLRPDHQVHPRVRRAILELDELAFN